jgi:hypothetical protein
MLAPSFHALGGNYPQSLGKVDLRPFGGEDFASACGGQDPELKRALRHPVLLA